jgi:molybdopterin-containing oxidoreductase family membrane subunit
VGAFVAGTAAVIILMYVYRLRYGLKNYYEDMHFERMGRLLVLVLLVYMYFNINEFLVPVYKMKLAEGVHLSELFSGGYAFMFWFVQIVGLALPIVLILLKYFRKPLPLTIISLVVLVLAWFKRYLIVVPTMEHPFLPVQNVPEHFQHYSPTSIEIMIMLFSFCAALLIISLLAKLFPVISMWEYAEEKGIDKKYFTEEPNR